MYEKFGEFDSYMEINELADNLLNENDIESLKAMAEENGIDQDTVEAFAAGEIMELCDAETAAVGKVDREAEEAKIPYPSLIYDWIDYIKVEAMRDRALAESIRRKGKSLKGCLGAILKWSAAHQWTIPTDIAKEAGFHGKVTHGEPDMSTVRKIIKDYYMAAKS